MADDQIRIDIMSYLNSAGFNQAYKAAERLRKQQIDMNAAALKFSKATGATFQQSSKYIEQATKEMQRFKFEWLGIMFAGMALQRTFGSLMRSAWKTWSTVTEGTNMAGGAMTQLQASWEFFKFSMIDALLNSPFFQLLIQGAIAFIDYLSTMSDDVGFLSLALLGIGTTLAVGGQVMLGVSALQTALSNAKGEAVSLGDTMKTIGGAIAITYAFKAAADAYDEFSKGDYVNGILDAAESGAMAVGGYKLIRGSKGAGWWFAIAFGLKLVEDTGMMRQIGKWMSAIGAVVLASAEWIGLKVGASIASGFADSMAWMLEQSAALIENIPGMEWLSRMMSGAATGIRAASQGLQQSTPDFKTLFEANYQLLYKQTEVVSNLVETTKNYLDSIGNTKPSQANEKNVVYIGNPEDVAKSIMNYSSSKEGTGKFTLVLSDDMSRSGYATYG